MMDITDTPITEWTYEDFKWNLIGDFTAMIFFIIGSVSSLLEQTTFVWLGVSWIMYWWFNALYVNRNWPKQKRKRKPKEQQA